MRLLFIGDVVGKPGRNTVKELLPEIKKAEKIDLTVANGENIAAGIGINPRTADELLSYGVDVITTGNHIWAKKDVYEYVDKSDRVIRPANLLESNPGKGFVIFDVAGTAVAVVNLMGIVFMKCIRDPFQVADALINDLRSRAKVIVVDFHAEATSEKVALGYFLDGRVSALIGTHTHIHTADEKILAGGTAYITDVGMTGPVESVLGVQKELVIERFLTQLPIRWEVADTEETRMDAVIIDIDKVTGRSNNIRRKTWFQNNKP